MKALDRLFNTEERAVPALSPDAWWMFNGATYLPVFSYQQNKVVPPDPSFEPLVRNLHDRHPVISAAVVKRAALLSELVFRWQSTIAEQNGRQFGNRDLDLVETPNGWQTRPEFLRVAEYHASYAGNAFIHRDGRVLRLLNPSWVSIVLGSQRDAKDPGAQLDAEVIGYMYQPGGSPQFGEVEFIPADEVAHWRPEPDPVCWWRGRSWVQAIISEWVTDTAATTHVHSYFEHAATPNLVFALDENVSEDQVKRYAEMIAAGHGGAANAYKSIVMGGGADVKVVGADLAALDLKSVQGLTETRIALRSQVPAVILQVSEGMQGSSLNAGNYGQARRLWGDIWVTPTANDFCATLQKILDVPSDAQLSFDRARIMFLQDDRKDEADILAANAQAIRTLLDAGFKADTAVAAVNTSDLTKLEHSGLFSVQLQPAGTTPPALEPAPQP